MNNLRADLNAFFMFCQAAPRKWTRKNPVRPIPKFLAPFGASDVGKCVVRVLIERLFVKDGPFSFLPSMTWQAASWSSSKLRKKRSVVRKRRLCFCQQSLLMPARS